MTNLIESSVRLPAFPPAFARDVKQTIDARGQLAGFGPQLGGAAGITSPLKQRGDKPHPENIAGIQRGTSAARH